MTQENNPSRLHLYAYHTLAVGSAMQGRAGGLIIGRHRSADPIRLESGRVSTGTLAVALCGYETGACRPVGYVPKGGKPCEKCRAVLAEVNQQAREARK